MSKSVVTTAIEHAHGAEAVAADGGARVAEALEGEDEEDRRQRGTRGW